ncbi:hypothetical protein [Brevibacillus daliensis]|uniref:hypothetical protein n=1 Tax=Brevibacillus daliensis TaxID=2892995 RepID=UPI001E637393|nr:hypothetical protein [Brevibacillus daliensis]
MRSFWKLLGLYATAMIVWIVMWDEMNGIIPGLMIAWFVIGVVIGSIVLINVGNSTPPNQRTLYLLVAWVSIYTTIQFFELRLTADSMRSRPVWEQVVPDAPSDGSQVNQNTTLLKKRPLI